MRRGGRSSCPSSTGPVAVRSTASRTECRLGRTGVDANRYDDEYRHGTCPAMQGIGEPMADSTESPARELPPAQSCRLIDFERADVVSLMIYPPLPPTL